MISDKRIFLVNSTKVEFPGWNSTQITNLNSFVLSELLMWCMHLALIFSFVLFYSELCFYSSLLSSPPRILVHSWCILKSHFFMASVSIAEVASVSIADIVKIVFLYCVWNIFSFIVWNICFQFHLYISTNLPH